ncbi:MULTISPECIES: LysR family transcriptional regulator [Variovorax]|jgi:DNA-binding transcriptional LysR family regulator|uniref:DNA-binding transcriptional LysR family regulator n=1 Tax=Variovorax paradoxus TaxID=34073 RepID=A0AAW8EK48_VARPD|nr:LysR family transcriptional regulator [Variovorax paradoxus]MBW8715733.1 LysR family transcriptional regulator [Variovorax paradoxus]MDP9972336.1 DNA-binding transcriptional LysR family regulator [Variovorax paradoxus]
MNVLDQAPGLVAFASAVEAGSFSAAARTLGTSPSAVSKSVARLEQRFGVRLFQRSTRMLSLTQEGAAYYERIAPLLRALDQAGDAMRPAGIAQGVLRITAPGDLGRILLEPVIGRFLPRHPELKLEMSLADRHVDLIREGYDIAIRAGQVADSDLTARRLADLPLVLVASPVYLARRGTPDSIEALHSHAHVRYMLGGKAFPIRFADGSVLNPAGVFDTDNSVALRIAALGDLGIVQILRLFVQDDIDAGRLVPVLPSQPLPLVTVSALHAFGRQAPARARLFIEFLAAELEGLS